MRATRISLFTQLKAMISSTRSGRPTFCRLIMGFCLVLLVFMMLSYSSNLTRIRYMTSMDYGEAHHVTFFKVHKTGSSTVQNIFLRFGDSRNLTFVLGSVKHNECANFTNCISFNNSLSETNIVPPPKNKHYDILCSHVIYNKEQFHKFLPPDTKYISLVREPVTRLASAVAHFQLLGDVNFSQFANDPIKHNHPRLNNAMSQEFGFREGLFPSYTHNTFSESDLEEIDQYAQELLNEFSLIMINERLIESLILMKRILNWKTQDILFINKMMRKHPFFDDDEQLKLKEFLKLDYAIYDSAMRELDAKIQRAGSDFQDEVRDFTEVNSAVTEYCKSRGVRNVLIVEQSMWNVEFNVTKTICKDLLKYEIDYIDAIRLKQYGTLKTE